MIRVLLAQSGTDEIPDPGNLLESWHEALGAQRELKIVLVILLMMSLGLFAWALSSSKRRRHHRHRHRHHRNQQDIAPAAATNGESDTRESRRERRHRRRRDHRPRNPTLAETGGLPPVRDPEKPPPGP